MEEQSKGLKVKDFLGVFYREDRRIMVADEFEGARDVDEELSEYEGQHLRLVAHHRPLEPVDESRWGGGCCMLENSGRCPFGHHEDPRRAFVFNARGVLRKRDDLWILEQESGELECLVECLVGHRSQIIVITVPDVESLEDRIREIQDESPEGKTIDELRQKIEQTRDLLSEINRLKDDIDV
jgi:hypothetical protein